MKSTYATTTLLQEKALPIVANPKIRIAINGFGRIGRSALKVALERQDIEIVAINDLSDAPTLAHLFKYDSVYGIYKGIVASSQNLLTVDEKSILLFSEKDPQNLPWGKLKIDVVLECTGRFTKNGTAISHVNAGAKRVIISAPAESEKIYLIGVNAEKYQGEKIISNGSCTTNCIAPVVKIIKDSLGVTNLSATTIHALTAEQNIVDAAPPALHADLRRARAALSNIIPTSSGAATAVSAVFPDLAELIAVGSIRVPISCGSLTDFTFVVGKKTTKEEVNQIIISASDSPSYAKVVAITKDPLVSSDIVGNPASVIVDSLLTNVIGGNVVKIFGWYDNEWGYTNRLIDLATRICLI